MEKDVMYYALENAVKFNGKATAGAVIGKIIAAHPEQKKQMKELSALINKIVADVNKIEPEKQKELFECLTPGRQKPKKEKKRMFDFLKIKTDKGGKIRTAFPPGAEKYPHIGHAKACIINYLLAKEYNGKFILRFEDTNPETVRQEYYDAMINDLSWLSLKWDELHYASDYMKEYLKCAEKLIINNKAYMCICSPDKTKEHRQKGLACRCRNNSAEQNMNLWKEFPMMKEGKAILRLKIDMKHKNTTMRDPAIFRIIDKPHARHKTKYRIWPTYDLQTSVMDGINKITHRIRSKEFEMRNELQQWIQKELNYPLTKIYEMARFNMTGVLSSGRVIRENIKKGNLIGWDDPSLTTLCALRRRGFKPEAVWNFVIGTGITKSESTLTWDDLIVHNKRILDRDAKRYFFVEEPVKIKIINAPELILELKKHPSEPKHGYRKFKTNEDFWAAKKDIDKIKDRELTRLMDCLNFTKKGNEYYFDSLDHKKYKQKGRHIIHWLPFSEKNIPASILMPDKSIKTGLAEKDAAKLLEGEVIQFERFGFCRLDNKKNMRFWLAH